MRKLRLKLVHPVVALAFVAPGATAQSTSAPLQGIEPYIAQAMHNWGVPGLALAVIKDDSVVYEGGFGVRTIGTTVPVDDNTIFAIGSNTKLFTAVAAGMLVDAGRMHWDDPVTTYLPDFQLYDPWVTREITIRDLFTHRSGLGERGHMIAYGNDLSRAEVLRRVRYLKPNSSFRSQFGYQNLMVLAAGQAAAAAAGQSWDELVKRRIFEPLGMSSSTTSVTELSRYSDVATPHSADSSHVVPIPWRNIDNIGPAGAINSSVSDMAKWVRFILADGKVGGARLIKPATLREIESPQMNIPFPPDSLRPSIHFLAYGLGVMMNDYRGLKILSHTGGIDGMLSEIVMVPERRLGIVVLTNADGHNGVFDAVAKRVLDAYLGAPPRDWSTLELQRVRERERTIQAYVHAADSKRPAGTKPSLPLGAYAGRFTNPMYGDLTIQAGAGHLVLRLGSAFTADLSHWANDAFRVNWRGAPNDVLGHPLALFMVDPLGSVRSVRLSDETLDPPGMRVWEGDRFDRATDEARSRRSREVAPCADCATAPGLEAALTEMLTFELMPYSVNRWIGNVPEGRTTLETWSDNLRRGWHWDNDHFPVNQFAHPYSGALYFNSARSHGYSFWQAAPFSLVGSLMWEYFGEATRPSINDLANTTLGGITLGETMFRFSSMIEDDHAGGVEHFARALGAAVVDPPRALTRLLRGKTARTNDGPPQLGASDVDARLTLGYLRLDRALDQIRPARGPQQLYADYTLTFGDPFGRVTPKPFSAMRIDATLATGVAAAISDMHVQGYVATRHLQRGPAKNQLLALTMDYQYNSNRAFVAGGQSISGGFLARYPVHGRRTVEAELWANGIVLGAVRSDYGADSTAIRDGSARAYDYGPGVGTRAVARFRNGRETLAEVSYQASWYKILSGVARTHFSDIARVNLQVPLPRSLNAVSLGASQTVYRRIGYYSQHEGTRNVDGQTRLFASIAF